MAMAKSQKKTVNRLPLTTKNDVAAVKLTLLTIASLYVLAISLLMVITSGIFIWPFILFLIISLSSGYALYKVYKGRISNTLVWTIVGQAFLASLLLYPTVLATVADLIGLTCGGAEQCSEDPLFSHSARLAILVPMLILATFSYYRNR